MLVPKSLLGAAFGAVVLVVAANARAADAGCISGGGACEFADACCDPAQLSCDAFDADGGKVCGFLGCKANGVDCLPVTELGQTDPCCSSHCSPITYTCLAAGDPGPACVASGAACMARGGQCCNPSEVCNYHDSPTTMTCGARPPPPGDCVGDCGATTAGTDAAAPCVDGGASCASGSCSGSICDPVSSNSAGPGSSSSSGCACHFTGAAPSALPAASLSAIGLAAFFLRARRRRRARGVSASSRR